MNKIFLDTNIVLDLLASREPFFNSASQIFSLADANEEALYISSITIINTHYILSRSDKRIAAKEILRKLKVLVSVLALTDKIINLALNDSAFKDFEDGIQYYTAIENNIDVIITRDLKGFKTAKIPVMNAEEYLISRR